MPIDLPIAVLPLPYENRLLERRIEDVDLVVIHCTELPDMKLAREYGERVSYVDSGTGASGHFYIDRDGSITRYVDPLRVANHTRGYNPRSIGIELVNLGRYPNWFDSDKQTMTEPYPDAQIAALVALLHSLRVQFPRLRFIAGHEDLDLGVIAAADRPELQIRRKLDPGPLFPWSAVIHREVWERLQP